MNKDIEKVCFDWVVKNCKTGNEVEKAFEKAPEDLKLRCKEFSKWAKDSGWWDATNNSTVYKMNESKRSLSSRSIGY